MISGGVEGHSEREWVLENDGVDGEKVVLRLQYCYRREEIVGFLSSYHKDVLK